MSPFSKVYLGALRDQLRKTPRARLRDPAELGRRAVALGLATLDVARLHEQVLEIVLAENGSPSSETKQIRQAGAFFSKVVSLIEETHRDTQLAGQLKLLNQELRQRNLDLARSDRELKEETARRVAVEEALRKSEQHYNKSLEQSRDLQEQLRNLSHQILSVQEEERKRISRELHDQIVQTLTGINLRLANLTGEAAINNQDLQRKIISTQRLVERSVEVVHRFARDLRPTVLDDLGLIPALHSFMKDFAKRTGIRIHFTAFRSDFIHQLDGPKRIVLYRVAQEALTNVARHAEASQVKVTIQKVTDAIHLTLADNGKGFVLDRVQPKLRKRLGVLGMRERVQMVGGQFSIESVPRQGTTVHATIPIESGEAARHKAAEG